MKVKPRVRKLWGLWLVQLSNRNFLIYESWGAAVRGALRLAAKWQGGDV